MRQRSCVKLTAEDVKAIRQLASKGAKQSEIAHEWAISQQHVSDIVNHKRWKEMDEKDFG